MSEQFQTQVVEQVEALFREPQRWVLRKDIAEPNSLEPLEVKEWLYRVCEHMYIQTTHLAREAGVSPSTINRFVSGNAKNTNLNARTIEAVKLYVRRRSERLFAEGDELMSKKDIGETVRSVRFKTELAVDYQNFRAEPILSDDEALEIVVPYHKSFTRREMLAASIQQAEIGHSYTQGSIVLLERLHQGGTECEAGSHVLMLREAEQGVETLLCEVVVDNKKRTWAQPLTSLGHHAMILLERPRDRRATDVAVLGRVICTYMAPDLERIIALVP